ncbi:SDR family oxidoreductase [Streptomyces varsoviensis]|uniref:SDR family oxidoreductase n=1 Tax=Streptomyces varsoviensis TaxID=67373 RepID=UPI0033C49079
MRVDAVSPGATDTPPLDRLGVFESGQDAMCSKILFERSGCGQEAAAAVAFLASDAAGRITGQDITGQDITGAGGYGLGA